MLSNARRSPRRLGLLGLFLLLNLLVACNGVAESVGRNHSTDVKEQAHHEPNGEKKGTTLQLPVLEPVALEGKKLNVVATTSIIGDVVKHVGGDVIQLTTLMAPGQDPHSYEPSASALTAVAEADVIFVHGWNLEEGLSTDLENIAEKASIVPVAANIEPIVVGDGGTTRHEHGTVDPHTWLNPRLVIQWVENIEHVFTALNPEQAGVYSQNAEKYTKELEGLIEYYDQQVDKVPLERRKLVTSHDSLAYFARAYDFEVIGTVIPGSSTLAEPSATSLATLVHDMERAGVCTIFGETTFKSEITQTVANELSTCNDVQVLSLYTDAIGVQGSNTDSYISMMRANIDTIIQGMSH